MCSDFSHEAICSSLPYHQGDHNSQGNQKRGCVPEAVGGQRVKVVEETEVIGEIEGQEGRDVVEVWMDALKGDGKLLTDERSQLVRRSHDCHVTNTNIPIGWLT